MIILKGSYADSLTLETSAKAAVLIETRLYEKEIHLLILKCLL